MDDDKKDIKGKIVGAIFIVWFVGIKCTNKYFCTMLCL